MKGMNKRVRICSNCREKPCRPKQGTCLDCHRAYMKTWRAGARVLHGTLPRGTVGAIAKARRRLANSVLRKGATA